MRPTRRGLLAAGLLAAIPRGARGADHVAVGAIRWDAWQAPGSPTTEAVARALTPPRYHYRLPFFAHVAPDGRVAIEGGTQEVMDTEIAQARRAGLDYWAFVHYPRESPMSAGLRLYLASTRRAGLRFCLVSELAQWGTARDRGNPVLDWQAELLAHPDYQRVLGRPLYFLGFLSDAMIADRWGGVPALRAAVDRFRARSGNPYIVLMARPDPGLRLMHDLGADAIGAYAIAEAEPAAPYSRLAGLAEARWEEYAAAGAAVVPTVMSGWDRRPRIEQPMPWERWQRAGAGMDRYYVAPTPDELAAHLSRALEWIAAHPGAAPARAALIYAWNENDEGGWLVPTIPFDDSRLRAIRRVLCPPARACV